MNTRRTFLGALAVLATLAFGTAQAGDFPKGSPKFETRYKTALKKAQETGKPLIVVFSATWCGPCQAMKKDVYPSEAVKGLHDKFVWAYLDTDEKDNAKPAAEFKVSGIPHIQFLNSKGEAIDKQVGGTSPEAFAAKLNDVLKKAAPAEKKADS